MAGRAHLDSSSTELFTLGGKLRAASAASSLLCVVCERPPIQPRQLTCGDLLCTPCYFALGDSSTREFQCKRCNSDVTIDDCFRDKAIENDLKNTRFPCLYFHCPWLGSYLNYRDHIDHCKFAPVSCRNAGCSFRGPKSQLDSHLTACPAHPVVCKHCRAIIPRHTEEQHLSFTCTEVAICCPNGCGEEVMRGQLSEHIEKKCVRKEHPCRYSQLGCAFQGDLNELSMHERDSTPCHLKLVADSIERKTSLDRTEQCASVTITDLQRKSEAMNQQFVVVHRELARLAEEMNCQLAPLREGLEKLDASWTELQESFSELSLMVQTLQATSYNGEFIWKIPEVARRTKEARIGKTISLYSAPFFTSRFGYKMCLRLYLNGDGSGKGTHLSFFLTIMRGEYDTLLSWPFQQLVTLMLLDQDKRNNIAQSFCPEPASSSFWKPKTEMNVASGCPKFASLSVLNNPSYIRNDMLFLKVIVSTTGLAEP